MTPARRRPDPVVFRFFNEVGIIEQLARNRLERRLPHGLRLAQFSVLNRFVRLGGEWAPARLARAFQVTKGAMTNTVQRLEALGFVEVVPDPDDGRAKLVRITAAGRAAHRDAIAALGPDLATIEASFGAGGFADALPFLEAVRAHLDANRD